MQGATTVRELWVKIKDSVGAALDRMHPGVLIVGGLAAVVIAFGAFGLAMLDDGSALDDLGLDSPPGRAVEGDSPSGPDGTDAGGGSGDSLSEGLTTSGAGAGGGSGADGPSSGADGTRQDAMVDAGAPSPAGAAGSPATAPPTTRYPTTSDSVPRTTVPPTPATTAAPPSTPTTEPPHEPGVIGGLLDLLGLS
jgi:hypothetical protein